MLKKFAAALLAVAVLGLVVCNTVEGMGKNIQNAGEGMENASKKK